MNSGNPTSPTGPVTGGEATLSPHVRRVALVLIFGGIAAILDSTMVTIALRTLVIKLHSTDATIQWVTTAYLLALAMAIPVTGWIDARFGGRRAWMAALTIFVVGSVLCALSWNDASLIVFRVLQGFGAGLIFPLMQTLAVRAAGGRANARLISLISLPMALGPILGPVIGGVILNWLSWRWLFLVNVPVILVGLELARRVLADDRPAPGATRPDLDLVGLALLTPGLAGVLLGLSNIGEDGGVGHASVIVPLLLGVVLFGAFVWWTLRRGRTAPVIDLRLLRARSLSSASAALFAAGASLYAAMFLLPLYFQQFRGDNVLDAGLLLIPQGVGSLLARMLASRLMARFGPRRLTAAAFLLAAAATVPFAVAGPDSATVWLMLALLVRGVGIGIVLIPPMAVAYDDVEPGSVPDATMATRISQQVGASFGVAIVAVVLATVLRHGGDLAGFQHAFWWATGISVMAAVVALMLPSRAGARGAAAEPPRRGPEPAARSATMVS